MNSYPVDCLDEISTEIEKLNLPLDKVKNILKGGLDFIDKYGASLLKDDALVNYLNKNLETDKFADKIDGLKNLISKQKDLNLKIDLLHALKDTRSDLTNALSKIDTEYFKIKSSKIAGPAGNVLDFVNVSAKALSGDGSGALVEAGKVAGGIAVGAAVGAAVVWGLGALTTGLALTPMGAAAVGIGYAIGNFGGGELVETIMKSDLVKPFVDQAGKHLDDFIKRNINNDSDDSTNNSPLPNKEEQNTPNQNNPDKEEKNKPNNQSNNPDKKPHCPWKDGLDPHRTPDTQVHDPLVLDLDGDGIETIAANGLSGSLFDHNNNGIRIATGWVGKDDGILVRDINGNGQIDNALELMSDKVRLSNGQTAAHGYEALADLDTDGNGKVDAADAAFSELRIWKDENQDGISQTDELHTLDKFNIQSLNTSYEEVDQDLGNQNILGQSGTYTKTDGSTAQMGDVWFAADETKIKFAKEVQLTAEQMQIVTLPGSGRVRQLREAAALSNTLNNIVQEYSKANTKEEQISLLSELMVEWAKTDPEYAEASAYRLSSELVLPSTSPFTSISTGGGSGGNRIVRTNRSSIDIMLTPSQLNSWKQGVVLDNETKQAFEDAKYKIAVLDALKGTRSRTFYYGTVDQAKNIIQTTNAAFNRLTNKIYQGLLFQTRLKPYLNELALKIENNNFILDFTAVQDIFNQVYHVNSHKALVDLGEFLAYGNVKDSGLNKLLHHYLAEASSNDLLDSVVALWGAQTIEALGLQVAGQNKPSLSGTNGNDTLLGNGGDNNLSGGSGDDTLIGGTGNDTLNGSYGNDTYVFAKGHGQDVVYEYTGDDTVRFTDVKFNEVKFRKDGYHLIIEGYHEGDSIRLSDFFNGTNYRIENFVFADQTVTTEQLFESGIRLHGTNGNDSISGWAGRSEIYGGEGNDSLSGQNEADVLDGGAGNDSLSGGWGNDILIGGTGNDTLNGSYGNDTYVFAKGHGQDVVEEYTGDDRAVFADVLLNETQFQREHYDLLVKHGEQGDSVRIRNFFSSVNNQVESFVFHDVTVSHHAVSNAMRNAQNMADAMAAFGATETSITDWSSDALKTVPVLLASSY